MLKSTSLFLKSLGITGPTVVIDEPRVRRNISRMTDKASRAGIRFRPHFKTHQSGEIGRWFAAEGVDGITVSSLAMAEYFATHGWQDITVAFLLNPLEWPQSARLARRLADRGGRLGLTVDSPAAAQLVAGSRDLPVDVWVKIDTGYGRTGVIWDQSDRLAEIDGILGGNLSLRGLLTHAGHSYQASEPGKLPLIWAETLERMRSAHEVFSKNHELLISVGDTPTCWAVDDLSGPDEIRPGNFVFHDLMQIDIGSCAETDLAAAVACPVVGIYPERMQIVIHGGAVHLGKEFLESPTGGSVFGRLAVLEDSPLHRARGRTLPGLGRVLKETALASLSQEHGIVQLRVEDWLALAGNLEIGDLVLVWPVHSCLTCNLHREYLTLTGIRISKR